MVRLPAAPLLTFPKRISIQNPRLNLAFYVVTSVFLLASAVLYVESESFLERLPVTTRLYVKAAEDQSLAQSALSNPSENPACAAESACMTDMIMLEATYDEESGTQFMAYTSWDLETVGPDPAQLPRRVVPSAHQILLLFQYTADVQGLPQDIFSRAFPRPSPRTESSGAATVILDGNGRPVRQVLPGDDVLLSAAEVLSIANGAPGDYVSGDVSDEAFFTEVMLFEGAEVNARVDCYADDDHVNVAIHSQGPLGFQMASASPDQPLCVMRVSFVIRGAQTKQLTPLCSSEPCVFGLTYVRLKGLRVRTDMGQGFFAVFSAYNLYIGLASLSVAMKVPGAIVFFITIHALGHMSRIYKQAIVENFDLRRDAVCVASRLMVYSTAFVELADVDSDASGPSGKEDAGLSRDTLAERLEHILECRGSQLDRDETLHLVDFCYDHLLAARERGILHEISQGGKSMKRRISKSGSTTSTGDADRTKLINIDDFSRSCGSADRIHFEEWVRLFDRSRRQSFLERLFTPNALRFHTSAGETLGEAQPQPTALSEEHAAGPRMQAQELKRTQPNLKASMQLARNQVSVVDDLSHSLTDLQSRVAEQAALTEALVREDAKLDAKLTEEDAKLHAQLEERLKHVLQSSRDELDGMHKQFESRQEQLEGIRAELAELRQSGSTPPTSSVARPHAVDLVTVGDLRRTTLPSELQALRAQLASLEQRHLRRLEALELQAASLPTPEVQGLRAPSQGFDGGCLSALQPLGGGPFTTVSVEESCRVVERTTTWSSTKLAQV